MKHIFVFFLIGILSFSAHAKTHLLCAESIDPVSGKVEGFELELLSESDRFSGPVGHSWTLKWGSLNSDWLKFRDHITAETYGSNGDTVIEIKIKIAETSSGPVGILYKLVGLYQNSPILEKYAMGGVVGLLKTDTFQCIHVK